MLQVSHVLHALIVYHLSCPYNIPTLLTPPPPPLAPIFYAYVDYGLSILSIPERLKITCHIKPQDLHFRGFYPNSITQPNVISSFHINTSGQKGIGLYYWNHQIEVLPWESTRSKQNSWVRWGNPYNTEISFPPHVVNGGKWYYFIEYFLCRSRFFLGSKLSAQRLVLQNSRLTIHFVYTIYDFHSLMNHIEPMKRRSIQTIN